MPEVPVRHSRMVLAAVTEADEVVADMDMVDMKAMVVTEQKEEETEVTMVVLMVMEKMVKHDVVAEEEEKG